MYIYIYMCVCVCTCLCACVRAFVRVWLHKKSDDIHFVAYEERNEYREIEPDHFTLTRISITLLHMSRVHEHIYNTYMATCSLSQ